MKYYLSLYDSLTDELVDQVEITKPSSVALLESKFPDGVDCIYVTRTITLERVSDE